MKHGIERENVLLDREVCVVSKEAAIVKLCMDSSVLEIQNEGKHHCHSVIEEQYSGCPFMNSIDAHRHGFEIWQWIVRPKPQSNAKSL